MRSSFLEFNIVASGLYASKTALSVTSNNIANANTKGYSRQYVIQKATMPISGAGKGMLGTGTEIVDINQIREFYLDVKFWNQNAILGGTQVKEAMLGKMEMLFNEPSDSGVNKIINNFFESLQDLTKDTSDLSYYSSVKEAATSFVGFFNDTAQQLYNYQNELNNEIKIKVNQINSIAFQIKSLNEQIYRYELGGNLANDLRDQRANLIDDLSKIISVEVEEVEKNPELKKGVYNIDDRAKSDKHFIVKINGQILVDHYDANELTVVPRESKKNPEDIDGLYDIRWKTGLNFDITSPKLDGELKGYVDLRDGNNGVVFNGDVTNVDLLNSRITVNNISRSDIQNEGIIMIGADPYEYTSYTYNEATGEITFQLVDATGVNIGDNTQIGTKLDYKGIPHYLSRLNEFARTVARAFNEGEYSDGTKIPGVIGNRNGYTLDGSTGNYLFAYSIGGNLTGAGTFAGYNNITALNLSLSKEFFEDPQKIAISNNIDPNESDNSIIHQLLSIKTNGSLFSEGTVQDYISATIGELAVDSKQAQTYGQIQSNIIQSVENQKLSVSGVDLNEEMSNMVKFQTAYNAAARMITVIDEIYNTTINNMGAR